MELTIQNYALAKLDMIRETQLVTAQRDLDMLNHILADMQSLKMTTMKTRDAEAAPTTTKSLFRVGNWSPFWQSCAAGGLFWILGICSRAYLSRGGDPMALLELILKSLL